MKIGVRLTIGFAIVVLLIIPSAFIALHTYHRIDQEFQAFKDDIVPGTIAMGQMQQKLVEAHHYLMEYMVHGKDKDVELAMSTLKDLAKAGVRHLEHETHIGLAEQDAAEQLLSQIEGVRAAIAEIIELKKRGTTPEQLRGKEDATVHPITGSLMKALKEHKAVHMQELADAERAVHRAQEVGRAAVVLAMISTVLGAIAVGFVTTRSMVRPLRVLQEAAEKIAKGNLDYRVGMDRKDEIGALARAIDQMAEDLSNTLSSRDSLEEANRALDAEIANHIRTEEKLRENREQLRITLSSIGDAVIAVDSEQCVTTLNAVAEELTGWSESEGIGRPLDDIFQIINEETRAPVENPVDKVLATGRIEGLANHTVLIARDGTERAIADSAAPISDAFGRTVGVVLVFRDVSEERAHQIEKERLLHSLGERVKELDCLYELSDIAARPQLTLSEVFEEAVKLLPAAWGYPEITTGRISWEGLVFETHPKCESPWCMSADIRVVGWDIGSVEVCYREPRDEQDEGPFIREERALIDAFAEQLGTVIKRKWAEEELERAKKAAEDASLAKSEFLANMSHEIRTPMTAIMGYADLLTDPGFSDEERRGYLNVVRRNGEHLLSLINDILDLSKIEAGKLKTEMEPCNIISVVADVASIMRIRAEQQGISLSVEYVGELPETILTDPARLRQAMINLVNNAVKFTERGSVRVVVSLIESWGDGRPAVRIQVIDTGIGISKENISCLFEPFVQGDSSTSRKFGGTGLGLTITRHIMDMLRGDLGVESTVGQGSMFTLTVPTGNLEGVRMFTDPTEAVVRHREHSVSPSEDDTPLTGLRILLVEDGVDNQMLIKTVLDKAGAEVHLAENGLVAVHKGSPSSPGALRFDVILMDMQMPEMDGYEATHVLRSQGYTGPILALTAHAMAGDKEKSLRAGCDDHVTKPINRSQLVETILEHVQGEGRSERSTEEAPAARIPDPVRSEFADDTEMVEVIDKFVGGLGDQIEGMREALSNSHFEELRRCAHQLKGAGGGYGYPSLTETAKDLEDAAKAEDVERATLVLSGLRKLSQAVIAGHPTKESLRKVES